MTARLATLPSLVVMLLAVGCAPSSEPVLTPDALLAGPAETQKIGTNGIATNGIATNGIATNGIATNGIATNGIATNGIATNGIATNGIATNGIATNGIATNGIATNGLAPGDGTSGLAVSGLTASALAAPEFQAWFAASPAYADMVMTYVVKCALPEGSTLAFEFDNASYAWPGVLGVAPRWAAGEAIGAAEQELMTACLAAHTNALGRHVTISVRGYLEDGSTIATTAEEVAGWRFQEACFFGNLFDGAGIGIALQPDSLDPLVSTPRGCAAEFGVPGECPPMIQTGLCADLCTRGVDGVTWERCTVNGRSYRALSVYLQDADVYRCGDGICQFTEDASRCAADCATP